MTKETENERLLSGKLYNVYAEELTKKYERKDRLLRQINDPRTSDSQSLLKKLLHSTGNHFYIEPPFFCDFGSNISVGDDFYANTNGIFLDSGKITIGDRVLIGPRVSLLAAGHPIDAAVRSNWLGFGHPITIGNDVWIGGGAIINPRVTVGSNVVIGSGAVVTKDIPDNVVVVGNPGHILRAITDEDKQYWQTQQQAYLKAMGPLKQDF